MKRNVKLYISGKEVELSQASLISFNYLADDLSNPTTVQNSYTRQIELPATAGNNAIFEGFTRLDRVTGQNGYNPLKRAEFVIYDDSGIVLEKGYAKLDSVSTKGDSAYSYSVSLYGGLGALFYSLMYDDEGNSLTLASLDYLSGGSDELTFDITRAEVRKAWQQIAGTVSSELKYNVINFAPAYNGIPDKNFDAGKAIFVPSDCGLSDTSGNYGLKNGYALVSFKERQDEWAVKDFRSYLQRPVIRMKAILDAIKDFAATKGYTVNYDGSFFENNPYYDKTWLTLPMLNELTLDDGTSGSGTFSGFLALDNGNETSAVLSIPSGAKLDSLSVATHLQSHTSGSYGYLGINPQGRSTNYQNAYFIQALIRDAQDNIIAATPTKVLCSYALGRTAAEIGSRAGYTPLGNAGFDNVIETGHFVQGYGSMNWSGADIPTSFSNLQGAYKFCLHCEAIPFEHSIVGWVTSDKFDLFPDTVQTSDQMGEITKSTDASVVLRLINGTFTYSTAGQYMRSGATITKKMLLGGSHTPADYLIGYAKLCGLQFVYDAPSRTVNIMSRGDAFAGGRTSPLDIESRIDRSRAFTFKPYLISKRYLDFEPETNGQWADYYKSVYGGVYGAQRVNTGYEFSGEHENVLDGIAFRACADVLERTKTFIKITTSSDKPYPAPFISADNSYTLYDASGTTTDVQIPAPNNAATIDYFNPDFKGYDAMAKAQFHSDDNKPIDGKDCLLFFNGMTQEYSDFLLSDDISAMLNLNDGVPCYMLEKSLYRIDVDTPSFRRYYLSGTSIKRTLDMGTPQELDNPDINVTGMENRSLYKFFWNNYIADRYDKDAKVLTCYVDFTGMQVGAELLRKMYWFDNCLWVLNKITDYDVASYDSVLCEFVKVKDKNAYADTVSDDLTTTANPLLLTFGSSGGTQSVVITSTDAWTLGTLPDWLTASQSSGGTTGVNTTTTVIFTAGAYSGSVQRSATLNFIGTDSSCSVSVRQSASQGLSTSVSPSSLTFAASGEALSVVVTSNDAWTIDALPSWLTASVMSGGVSGQQTATTVTFTATANPAEYGRAVSVTIRGGNSSAGLLVSQNATVVARETSVTPTSLSFSANGETQEVVIDSNDSWTIGSLPSWLHVSQASGGESGTISHTSVNFTADSYSGQDTRTHIVIIQGVGSRAQLTINQSAHVITYALQNIADGSISAAGGTYAPAIYGIRTVDGVAQPAQLLTPADGAALTKGSGDTNNQLSIVGLSVAGVNLGTNARNAISVQFTCTWHGVTKTFTVSQGANTYTDGDVILTLNVAHWNTSGTTYAAQNGDTTSFTYTALVPRTWSSGSVQQISWGGTPTFSVTGGVGLTISAQNLTWAANDSDNPRQAQLLAYNGSSLLASFILNQSSSAISYGLDNITGHSFSEYGGTWTPAIYGITYVNGVQTDRRLLTASDGVTLSKGTDTYNQFSASGIAITAVDLELNERVAASVSWIAEWHGVTKGFTTTQAANALTYELDAVPNNAFTAAGGTFAVDPMATVYRNGVTGWRGRLTAADGCSVVKGIGDRYGNMSVSGFTITAADLMTTAYDAVSVAFSLVWTGKDTVNFTCTQALNMEISQFENPTDLVMLFVDSQQTEISSNVLSTGGDVYLKGRYIYELWGHWSSGHDAYYSAGQTSIVDLTNITVEPQSGITVHPYNFAYVTVAAQVMNAPARQWNVLGRYTNSAGTVLTCQNTLTQNAGYILEYEYTMLSVEWDSIGSGQGSKSILYNNLSYQYFYAKQTVNVYKVADGTRTLYDSYLQGAGADIAISDTANFQNIPNTIDGDSKGMIWARSNNTSGSARQCVITVSAIDNPSSSLSIVLNQQSA